LRSGILRDRCHVQQDTSNDDTPTADFSGTPFLANWPCKIVPISGDESYRGRQLESTVDYVVSGRFRDGVTPKMRVYVTAGTHKGKTFNIDNARESLDKQNAPILELYCTELKI